MTPTPKSPVARDVLIERKLASHLEQRFSTAFDRPLSTLPDTCESIASCIQTYARSLVFESIVADLESFTPKPVTRGDLILWRDSHYLFRAGPSPNESGIFEVNVSRAGTDLSKSVAIGEPLPLGRAVPFRNVVVSADLELVEFLAALPGLCVSCLSAGYRWLEEFCMKVIEADRSEIVDELYRRVRSALPEHCADKVWLYVLTKDHSIYVFDKLAQQAILESATGLSARFGRARADTLARLAGSAADPQKTSDFRVVIPKDEVYYHDPIGGVCEGNDIALPQFILFDGKKHCIQPLIGNEAGGLEHSAIWLTAVYPIPLRPVIEDRLALTRPDLSAFLLEHRNLRRQIARKARQLTGGDKLLFVNELVTPWAEMLLKVAASTS